MSSYIGQPVSTIQGDIRCNAVYTQTLQSGATNVTMPPGYIYLSTGQLGLEYKTAATLIITARMNGGLDPEYASVLAYISNGAIIATVTMMSSPGVTINTDGINLQILNDTPATLQAAFSMLWL